MWNGEIIRLAVRQDDDSISMLDWILWAKGKDAEPEGAIYTFETTASYQRNTTVLNPADNLLYRSLGTWLPGAFNANRWIAVPVLTAFVRPHDPVGFYDTDELAYNPDDEKVYITAEAKVGGIWDAGKWDELVPGTFVKNVLAYDEGGNQYWIEADGFETTLIDPDEVATVDPAKGTFKVTGSFHSSSFDAFDVGDIATDIVKASTIADDYTTIFINCVRPDLAFDKGNPAFTNTGLRFLASPAATKEDLKKRLDMNLKVFLTLGGPDFSQPVFDGWSGLVAESKLIDNDDANYPNNTPILKSMVDLLEYTEATGYLIDFRDRDDHWESYAAYMETYAGIVDAVHFACSKLTDKEVFISTSPNGWDNSFYAVTDSVTPNPTHGYLSWFDGPTGRERSLIGGWTNLAGSSETLLAKIDGYIIRGSEYNDSGSFSVTEAYKEARVIVTSDETPVYIEFDTRASTSKYLMEFDKDCDFGGDHPTVVPHDQYLRPLHEPFSLQTILFNVKETMADFADDGFSVSELNVDHDPGYTFRGETAMTTFELAKALLDY